MINGNKKYDIINKENKCNFTDKNGILFSTIWFDRIVEIFYFGFSCFIVHLNNKCNIINIINNKIIYKLNTWVDTIQPFKTGFVLVELNKKYNIINKNYNLISNVWFDELYYHKDMFALIKKNSLWNFINNKGVLFSNIWFDHIYNPHSFHGNNLLLVRKNKKHNLVNNRGHLISNLWFDCVYEFKGGFIKVELNNKYNIINKTGELVFNNWLNNIYPVKSKCFDIFWFIEKNKKWNVINVLTKNIISKTWFDNIIYNPCNNNTPVFTVYLNQNTYKLDIYGNFKHTFI